MVAKIATTPSSQEISEALHHLKRGGVVVLPTDTLYGLAADVFNQAAVQRVFAAKGRPPGLALPVLVSDWAMVATVAVRLGDQAQRLAEKFWPGPLTLVLPKQSGLPDLVTAGRDTIAVRSPEHWVPQMLISRFGSPVTGTSANLSGRPDPRSLAELRVQLEGHVDYIIRSGPPPMGTASTIVDISSGSPKLIREGAIPFQEILKSS